MKNSQVFVVGMGIKKPATDGEGIGCGYGDYSKSPNMVKKEEVGVSGYKI